jgi:RNA polymerase sigma factor (sigma-70 family)
MSVDLWTQLVPRLEADLRARASGNVAERDDDAWAAATSLIRWHGRVLARSHALDWAAIDDIVQEVLLKLQSPQTLLRLKRAGSAAGYVAVVIRNAATDHVRRQRKILDLEGILAEDLRTATDEGADSPQREQTGKLHIALQSLRRDELILLKMRFWENLSITQISKALDTSYSAIAVRFFRIFRKLREEMGVSP